MTIDRHFIHDSLYRSLEMRDTLANSGETAGASAAQKLADRLWELTKPPATPIQTTGPTGEAEARDRAPRGRSRQTSLRD